MGNGGGPSPLVPSLVVGTLGLVIFGPTLLSLLEVVPPVLLSSEEDDEGRGGVGFSLTMALLCVSLLLIIQLFSWLFPSRGTPLSYPQYGSGDDHDDGFGLGSLLLLLLFFVLYSVV
ncbi:hypothetical protein CDL15_Pgr014122 [Punica granatum]|uniref:Uncharacterized protein n=1 Tax=Punica granatum TaxID=22663 RepID=A0A218VWS4_PUNGR|nr:hypothetical protein CDL15_Pgr014122 [Punica granatum]PKI63776.1 hypothetical protein CRG98_015846 [Punica granatum]